jgi:hypothetical protein
MKKYITLSLNTIFNGFKSMFRGELVEVTFTPGSSNYTYVKIAE